MNSDQDTRGFLPPGSTSIRDELHRQPSSSAATTTGNNLHHLPGFITLPLPRNFQTPSPTTARPTSNISSSPNSTAGETTTPESRIAGALGRALFTIPSTSFPDALAGSTVNTQSPIRRTLSDTTSSAYQEPLATTPTPPNLQESARRNLLRRTASDPISTDYQESQKTTTPPARVPGLAGARTFSPSPNSRTTAPESSIRKESPQSKRLRKMEEMVRDIEQRCWEVMRESGVVEHVQDDSQPNNDANPSQAIVEQDVAEATREECVELERLSDGGLRILLSCSCGRGFDILLKHNGFFYRLT